LFYRFYIYSSFYPVFLSSFNFLEFIINSNFLGDFLLVKLTFLNFLTSFPTEEKLCELFNVVFLFKTFLRVYLPLLIYFFKGESYEFLISLINIFDALFFILFKISDLFPKFNSLFNLVFKNLSLTK